MGDTLNRYVCRSRVVRMIAGVMFVVLASEGMVILEACMSMSMNARRIHKERANLMMESGLAFIETVYDDPYHMFSDWLTEALTHNAVMPGAVTLATATRAGKVSARTMLLKRVDEDGLVLVTTKDTQKTKDFAENPFAALVFKWEYKRRGKNVVRQVRVEGRVQGMLAPEYVSLYDEELLYKKLQYHVMQPGEADWWSLKNSHDTMWMSVVGEGRELPMPDSYMGFKVLPEMFEFYHAERMVIPDRIVYVRDLDNDWDHSRIAA